jgi:hypothetical protein
MANRIWQGHFGSGLVRTPSDFGLRAEPPSHPELLDWLAHQFINSGWSIKTIHRLIMLSSAYQQSSLAEPLQTDPDNRLLSHFPRNRLDLESTRDAMLAATGELKPVIGGKPTDLLAAANTRRTLYSLVDRQYLNATYRMFDFANPDLHVGQRHNTTVPQQALFFLNNPFVAERARALAHFDEKTSPETRVREVYKKVYQREPTKEEIKLATSFVAAAEKDTPPPARVYHETRWQYGWGEYDHKEKKVKSFNKLPHFTGDAWQGGPKFPDDKLGWVQLTATGGHPGNDLKHAVIRRWVAPVSEKFSIGGRLTHEPEAGDGIRATIVSSRHGELISTNAHHKTVEIAVTGVEVKEGDTIDFIVDIRDNLNSDQFIWAPIIASWQGSHIIMAIAEKDFHGPKPKQLDPLQPWAQFIQTLLISNEFSFID